MKKIHAFGKFAQTQIEQARAMTIDQHDAEAGKCSQQLGQRFQVEMAVHLKLGSGQLGRQIILAPEALRRAGEHSFGASAFASRATAARAATTQILRQAHDAVEIGAGRLELIFTIAFATTAALASALQLAQCFPRQILGQDRLFLVSLIARRSGLEVKAESASCRIFKFCQFVDLFPSDHSVIPVLSNQSFQRSGKAIYAVPVLASIPLNCRTRRGDLRRCSRAAAIEISTRSGELPVMAEISSTPKPSRACRMKASRWTGLTSCRAEAIRRIISSEPTICSGVATRSSAMMVSSVMASSG